METPEFLMGDNSEHPDDIFVIHTQFPRFIINLKNDEIQWLEEFSQQDREELIEQTEYYIRQATAFYDREVTYYQNEA